MVDHDRVGRVRRALRLRWSTVALAMAATLIVAHLTSRTWSAGAGGWPTYTSFWPWYVYRETDHLTGPNGAMIVASLLSGVAVWYLPAGLVVGAFHPAPHGEVVGRWYDLRFRRVLAVVGGVLLVGVVPVFGLVVLLPGILVIAVAYGLFGEPSGSLVLFWYFLTATSLAAWYLLASRALLAVGRLRGDGEARSPERDRRDSSGVLPAERWK